jgi:FG-GAP repeat
VEEQTPVAAVSRRSGVLLLIAAGGVLLFAAVLPGYAPRAAGPGTAVEAVAGADVGADFNGDGFADLAVGVPGESVTVGDHDIEAAGAVHVIYGSSTGLNGNTPLDDEVWHQNRFSGFVTTPERDDSFGYALAAGDFDADGFDDLAIGAPGEDVHYEGRNVEDAGEVDVLRGSLTGLAATIIALRQGSRPVGSAPQAGDYFGFSLAAGDLGYGRGDDLVIGAPYEDWPSPSLYPEGGVRAVKDAGAVTTVFGAESRREMFSSSYYWTQDTLKSQPYGIADQCEAGDRFGFSVAITDLGKHPADDLVIGVPYEDVGAIPDAGAVNVIYVMKRRGFVSPGLVYRGNQLWHQSRSPDPKHRLIPDRAEAGDHFGWALAGANFGFGWTGDLAVGVPDEDLLGRPSAGAVNVVYSLRTGLTPKRAQLWHQGSAGIQGDPETFDRFGYALTTGDFGFGLPADLAVGVRGETRERFGPDAEEAGAVNILMGTPVGLRARNNLFEAQDNSGIDGAVEGDSETADWFGSSLTAGDFGKGPGIDLAVGVPGESKEGLFSTEQKVGAVNVLYSDRNGLRAIDDQFWWQASDSLHDKAEEVDEFGRALAH